MNTGEAIGAIRAFDALYPEKKTLTEAHALALAALREQAERNQGCDACGLIYKLDGASYGTTDEIIDNRYCPMCGKRLEVKHESDQAH